MKNFISIVQKNVQVASGWNFLEKNRKLNQWGWGDQFPRIHDDCRRHLTRKLWEAKKCVKPDALEENNGGGKKKKTRRDESRQVIWEEKLSQVWWPESLGGTHNDVQPKRQLLIGQLTNLTSKKQIASEVLLNSSAPRFFSLVLAVALEWALNSFSAPVLLTHCHKWYPGSKVPAEINVC
jgi:hypothetical protein